MLGLKLIHINTSGHRTELEQMAIQNAHRWFTGINLTVNSMYLDIYWHSNVLEKIFTNNNSENWILVNRSKH